MKITYAGKDYELLYTFNSMKYMEDFNLTDLEEVKEKPFKIIKIASIMLFGALNHNPKEFVDVDVVDGFIQEMDMGFPELVEDLFKLLEKSDFFKQLQITKTKGKK